MQQSTVFFGYRFHFVYFVLFASFYFSCLKKKIRKLFLFWLGIDWETWKKEKRNQKKKNNNNNKRQLMFPQSFNICIYFLITTATTKTTKWENSFSLFKRSLFRHLCTKQIKQQSNHEINRHLVFFFSSPFLIISHLTCRYELNTHLLRNDIEKKKTGEKATKRFCYWITVKEKYKKKNNNNKLTPLCLYLHLPIIWSFVCLFSI